MEFWTVLWITVMAGPMGGVSSQVLYPSLEACEAALTPVSLTLAYDHSLLCEESTTVSRSIRPKGRASE